MTEYTDDELLFIQYWTIDQGRSLDDPDTAWARSLFCAGLDFMRGFGFGIKDGANIADVKEEQ